jgi:Ni/Fe-hydrogenase subunit HybB-like protein
MMISPLLVLIFLLSVGFAVLFMMGTHYLVVRTSGHSGALSVTPDVAAIPTFHFVSPWHAIRTILAVLVLGTTTGIVATRLVYGIGAITNLSNHFPLGIWIGFDVMSGVALAAGGFVITAVAHIFNVERFKPLARPAVLTALLGYVLAVAGLMVDLGRPYNVWRPLAHWQYHSPLWEVGVCVATYTTVLFIEFLPVILERINKIEFITKRLPTVPFYYRLKKVSIVFVILGVVLSTLHQSSLGTLWVLLPTKVHPLWYSVYLPVFFWISAVAAGLTMTIFESTLSSKAFKRGLELDLLADLGLAASILLVIYMIVRGIDLYSRGAWTLLREPTLQTASFWVEMVLGVYIPALLLAIRPLRYKPAVLFSAALMVVLFGITLNRLNVSIISLLPYTGNIYSPSWMELMVTFALVGLGFLVFGQLVKYLPIFPDESEHASGH